MTRKRSERPTNRKERAADIPRPAPRGERKTDVGSHTPPTIQEIIRSQVKVLMEQNERPGIIESYDEFDNWETEDIDRDFTDHPRAEFVEMTEERFASIPKELLPSESGSSDLPLSSQAEPNEPPTENASAS